MFICVFTYLSHKTFDGYFGDSGTTEGLDCPEGDFRMDLSPKVFLGSSNPAEKVPW